MRDTGRHLAPTACIVLGCLLGTPAWLAAQTPVEGWSGQVQCVIASRGAGYQDEQTHTWVLSGAPAVRNDFRDYPATWTVSGSGRRTPISSRVAAAGVGDSWTYSGSDAGASITLFVPVGTASIRIAAGQRAVKSTSGIKGTVAGTPFAADAGEWRFQYIDIANGTARTTLSDSRTQTRGDMAGWRPPPGTVVTETCSWNFTKNGSGNTAAPRGAASASTTRSSNAPPSPDLIRQYTAIGRTPTPGTGVVIAILVDDAGAPLVGVPLADVHLLDATSLPVGLGPYIFAASGDIVDSNTLSVTTSFGGRSRVAFLDAPLGRLTLTVNYSRGGQVVTRSAQIVSAAGGVTVVQLSGSSPVTGSTSSTSSTGPTGSTGNPGAAAAAAAGIGTRRTADSDVARQYAVLGTTPAPGTGVVVATLVDDAGAPLVGVSVADIHLLDATSLPAGMGPYIFGATGDIVDSSTQSVTAAFNGRSRVAFLDAPVGRLTLTVIYSRDGKVVTRSAQVVTTAGGVTAVQP